MKRAAPISVAGLCLFAAGWGCISVLGKPGPAAPAPAPAVSPYCLQYATTPTQVHDDAGGAYAAFRALVANAAGEVFAGAFNFTAGPGWSLLKLPLAADAATTTAASWTSADAVAPAGAVAGSVIVDTLRDASGRLWVAGNAFDAGLLPAEAWVRMSADEGVTWNPMLTDPAASVTAISADAAGNIYVGETTGTAPDLTAVLKRSPDAGATWTQVFTSQVAVNQPTYFGPIVQLSAGTLILVGRGLDATPNWHGFVYSSTDGGLSYTTINDYRPATLNNAAFQDARVDAAGALWVTATADTLAATDTRWQVLTSADGGLNFTAVDDFLYTAAQGPNTAYAGKFFVDGGGRVFVPGYATDAAAHTHGLIRMTADGGTTWTTVYDYADPLGGNAGFYSLAANAALGVFAGGYGGTQGAVFRFDCVAR